MVSAVLFVDDLELVYQLFHIFSQPSVTDTAGMLISTDVVTGFLPCKDAQQ